jgi:hypothetical protein
MTEEDWNMKIIRNAKSDFPVPGGRELKKNKTGKVIIEKHEHSK